MMVLFEQNIILGSHNAGIAPLDSRIERTTCLGSQ